MSNVKFPDLVHVSRIREALWAREPFGRAAVMVGAGMSRNATSLAVNGKCMPTWNDLIRIIHNRLYPRNGTRKDEHPHRLTETESTARALQLAQEYQATSGRNALEQLIIDHVQDKMYEPGDLHRLLLSLPWSDVLTTNWDTLLERTRDLIVERRYDAVRTIEAIPRSQKPRIVKLHGSLPNPPFIFTEEDFRTYPQKFAPLVNLAQQIIMENVFCLIGFSGDDPNFLHWSGWVRDHFRDHAPRIFLVGWLELTLARRKMLEARNVTPIDISLCVECEWPEERRHEYALHWFLLSLRSPYSDMKWPRSPTASAVPKDLEPLDRPVDDYPMFEKAIPDKKSGPAAVSELRSQITVWRQNRTLYPGWIVAPRGARVIVWNNTRDWTSQALTLLSEFNLQERLEILDELNWRLELCLEPLPPEFIKAASRVSSEFRARFAAATPKARRQWVSLTSALLRAGREAGDHNEFQLWYDALIGQKHLVAGLCSRLAYERCLFSLSRFDFEAVERAVQEWPKEDQDPIWGLRRASVLAALGRHAESSSLAFDALNEIRRRGKGNADIANLSRENCALLFNTAFFFFNQLGDPASFVDLPFENYERLDRIAVYNCDVRNDINYFKNLVEKRRPRPRSRRKEIDHFDLRRVTITFQLFQPDLSIELSPAYQIARFLEDTGLPSMGNIRLSDTEKLPARAAEWLVSQDPQRAISIFLLGHGDQLDETFENLFSRSRIALFPQDLVVELAGACSTSIDFCIDKLSKLRNMGDGYQQTLWGGRLKVAFELLSRFVLRLDENRITTVLEQAIQLYGNRSVSENRSNVARQLSNVFQRIIECLKPQTLRSYALRFSSLPLVGLDDFDPIFKDGWLEPLAELKVRLKGDNLPTRLDDDRDWSVTIDRLLHAASREGLHPRSRAVARLSVLHHWNLLRNGETKRFARVLWEYNPNESGFPQDIEIADWELLELPEVEAGRATKLFRERYLSALNVNDDAPDLGREFLLNIYNATAVQPAYFRINDKELHNLWQRIVVWLRATLEAPHEIDLFSVLKGTSDVPKLVVDTMACLIFPSRWALSNDLGREAWWVIEGLRELKAPVERALPGFLRLDPSRFTEVAEWLRQSSASLDPGPAKAAVSAVYYWLTEGPRLEIEPVPNDLVREIGLAVATRRPSNILFALELATSMVEERSPAVDEAFVRLLAVGLGYLIEEARYERFDQEGHEGPERVELLRFHSVKLALALDGNGFGGISPVISEWLDQAVSDPMAGIRNLGSLKMSTDN